MDGEEQHLREKARMLLQREREYYELLQKFERLGLWLSLGQAFPEIFLDRKQTLLARWDRARKLLITRLRLQRVLIVEVSGGELRMLSPAGATLPLPDEVRSLLASSRSGLCNDADSEADRTSAALAQVLGLHRFMWSSIARQGEREIVIAAGFDRVKAAFQSPFVDNDAASFKNATQHIESLLANAQLVEELEHAADQLRVANESLEQRVRERTHELFDKNRQLRLVLDNVDQALLSVDLEGRLMQERSRAVDDWFGAYAAEPMLLDHIPADARFASLFKLGLAGLRDDILPREVCLDQMPKELLLGPRRFQCRFLPIEEGERLTALLMVIDDVTERRALARAEAEQRELLSAFSALMRDRNGFLSFVEQTGRLLQELSEPDCAAALQRRLLHTLKGNAATYGLHVVAQACHAAETELAELGRLPASALSALGARWGQVLRTVSSVAPTKLTRTLELGPNQLAALAERAEQGATASELIDELRQLEWEPVELSLRRLAQQAGALAGRLAKGPITTDVVADDLRLQPGQWDELWSTLVHAVRNAVDHGIERPEERAALGKPRAGSIRFSGRRLDQGFQLELSDDGRGIDWEAVRGRCREQGRPGQSQAELLDALLSSGFTTRRDVTETSGRGVGLAALDAVVRGLGGTLQIESESGSGTRLILTFPRLDVT